MKKESLSGNSPEENATNMIKDASFDKDVITGYNEMISLFVQRSSGKPDISISGVEDGSFLLKAMYSPFPPFITVISAEHWSKLREKISILTDGSTALDDRAVGCSSSTVDSGSKTPLSESGSNNLVEPIKYLPSSSPESSPTRGSSPSSSVSKYLLPKSEKSECRHPLKMRLHRTANCSYELVGSAVSSSSADGFDDSNEHLRKKAHKKSKKAKKHRVSIDDHVAYMIDESHLVEDRNPVLSSEFATENGSDPAVSNGSVPVEDVDCSFSKVKENYNNMDAVATWPAAFHENQSEEVAIWKKKQRRGEPVVKTPYVRRKCTPVTCTINLRSRSILHPAPPAATELPSDAVPRRNADKIFQLPSDAVPRRNANRLKTRYSVPPSSPPRNRLRRSAKSASPQCIRRSRYQPIYIDDDIIALCPFMNTRSRAADSRNKIRMIKLEDDVNDDTDVQKSRGKYKSDRFRVVKREDDTDSIPNSQKSRYTNGGDELLVVKTEPDVLTLPNVQLPLDAAPSSESNSSPHSQDRAPGEPSSVHSDDDGVLGKNSQMNSSSVSIAKYENPSNRFAAETDNGSLSDGLYIDEEETLVEKPDSKSQSGVDRESEQNRCQGMSTSNDADTLLKEKIKTEPLNMEEDSCAVTVKSPYEMTENEGLVDASKPSGSDLVHRTDHPVDPAVSYRYKMWSRAYRTFCTNPFVVPPVKGQVPQFVRYPSRSVRDVRFVTRGEKCYVKLGLNYEVAVSNPPKEPNERNWKEIYVGDVLWVRWRKNEYWPATAYSISDTAPVKVTVLWTNDKTQSTVDYTMVDSFDMAFHIRYDARRNDPKYVKAVATALRYMGKMGFWECHITAKVYDEIVKAEGELFCRHILPQELKKIKEKSKAPKLAKEAKKDDLTKMQKSEEMLQALQAAHFIDIYHCPPLVGNALPLTQQIVDDYQGSTEYASGNLDPLFADGSMLSFDELNAVKSIDPEVMGSNEIVQWDGDSGAATSGHDAVEASLGTDVPVDDGSASALNVNAFDLEVNEEKVS
ncbi:hypothetical protein OESDEN_02160 [Oesophagostomum dentatum]|uniref:PWWP domain-containing protein n=1 Tax=Oesophagostomum dentatum TaxID=61180 RepID=A0A0B1TR27_OESDE|nr:hypothetical protein OESDEN_02160 [Oesophagostomum dentatum]